MNGLFEIKTLNDNISVSNKNRLGFIEEAITIIGQFLPQIFGSSIDPGHWQGSLFIPGDLSNRIIVTQQKLQASGLAQYADPDEWMLILKTPGVWQSAIDNYINTVLKQRQQGTLPLSKNSPATGAGIISGSFGLNDITTLILVGAAIYFIASSGKKK